MRRRCLGKFVDDQFADRENGEDDDGDQLPTQAAQVRFRLIQLQKGGPGDDGGRGQRTQTGDHTDPQS